MAIGEGISVKAQEQIEGLGADNIIVRTVKPPDEAIADFQGDAALGFWGWPVPLTEGAIPACMAALAIFDDFQHPERFDGKHGHGTAGDCDAYLGYTGAGGK